MVWIPGPGRNDSEILHHLEVSSVIGFAQQRTLVQMQAWGDRQQALRGCIACADQVLSHDFRVSAARFLCRFCPEMHQAVCGFSGVVDCAVVAVAPPEALGEGSRCISIKRLEIAPAGEGSRDPFSADGQSLLLRDRQTQHGDRTVPGFRIDQTTVVQCFKKGEIAVAIERVDHDDRSAGTGLANALHQCTHLATAERQVELVDHCASFPFHLGAHDAIGGTGIDVVGADQQDALAAIGQHPVHGRFRLLIGHRSPIDHVGRALLAFVLNRIEQQCIPCFQHWQHGFAAG